MTDISLISIALGLLVSLLFIEFLGISPGGMIPLGYLALHLDKPLDILLTLVASLATLVIVRNLARVVVIYGRRQVAAMVLIGFLSGTALDFAAKAFTTAAFADGVAGLGSWYPGITGLEVIGFIIPGLIAVWLDRQGVFATICGLTTGSIIVNLLLVVIVPDRM